LGAACCSGPPGACGLPLFDPLLCFDCFGFLTGPWAFLDLDHFFPRPPFLLSWVLRTDLVPRSWFIPPTPALVLGAQPGSLVIPPGTADRLRTPRSGRTWNRLSPPFSDLLICPAITCSLPFLRLPCPLSHPPPSPRGEADATSMRCLRCRPSAVCSAPTSTFFLPFFSPL